MVKISEGFEFRHPFSVHTFSGESVDFLVERKGGFTKSLTDMQVGQKADLTGPLGNGFKVQDVKAIFALGGGIGSAPLAVFEKTSLKTRYLVGARNVNSSPGYGLPPDRTYVVTEDGSLGEKGVVTDYFEKFYEQGEAVFACGPEAMLRKVVQICRDKKVENAFFCLEALMVCGIGACAGCTTSLLKNSKKVCSDGPVFKLEDLV
ncbi:dihydroorotate dehydrogenase electron transfer subunit [candidate division WOR-3 bacterium]|nr:dihydroorotate dehydrogenase electron transfer subunit [candidate division WOR-3 bacterium]